MNQKIRVAFECPARYIPVVQEYTEFDFAIAHFVLENEEYAYWHRNRPGRKPLILDNGAFELKYPLPMHKIIEAAKLVYADYIIPPDYYKSFEETKRYFEDFLYLNTGYKLAPVVAGQGMAEVIKCYQYYSTFKEVSMYCWTRGSKRAEVLKELGGDIDKTRNHHLLGFSTLKELKSCYDIIQMPITIDTMKPVSATFCKEVIVDGGSGRYKRPEITEEALDEDLLGLNLKTFTGWISELA